MAQPEKVDFSIEVKQLSKSFEVGIKNLELASANPALHETNEQN